MLVVTFSFQNAAASWFPHAGCTEEQFLVKGLPRAPSRLSVGATTAVTHLQPPAGVWQTLAACWAPLPATASGWRSPAQRGGKQSLGRQPLPQGCSAGWGHGARQQHGLHPATETRTLQEREARRVRDPFSLDLCSFTLYCAP